MTSHDPKGLRSGVGRENPFMHYIPVWRSSGALASRSVTPEPLTLTKQGGLAIDMILKKAMMPSMRRIGVG